MGKEGIKRKPTWKKDIDSEYPKWPWVDYKFQDVNFFKDVKKLSIEGINPKGEITDVHVTTSDITHIYA